MTNAAFVALDQQGDYLPSTQGLPLESGKPVGDEPDLHPPFGIYHVSTPPQGGQR